MPVILEGVRLRRKMREIQYIPKKGYFGSAERVTQQRHMRDLLILVLGALISICTTLLAQYLQSSAQSDQMKYERRVDLLMNVMEFHNQSTLTRASKLAAISAVLDEKGSDWYKNIEAVKALEKSVHRAMHDYQVVEDQYRARMAMYVPIIKVVFGVDATPMLVDSSVKSEIETLFDQSGDVPAFVAVEAIWKDVAIGWLERELERMGTRAEKLESERVRVNAELGVLVGLLAV